MKAQHLVAVALAVMIGASTAQANDVDRGGKIAVACTGDMVSMDAVKRAVNEGHRWASEKARRQMLSIVRGACRNGAEVVTFVAPAERLCQTPPTWSTFCLDETSAMRKAPETSSASSSSALQ
jgi:hypothetical protein